MPSLKIKPTPSNNGYDINVIKREIAKRAKQFASRAATATSKIFRASNKKKGIVPVTNSSDSYEIDLASIVPVIKPNKTSRSSKIYPKNGGKTLKKRGRGGGARITRSSR
jgi:hypothetical protein